MCNLGMPLLITEGDTAMRCYRHWNPQGSKTWSFRIRTAPHLPMWSELAVRPSAGTGWASFGDFCWTSSVQRRICCQPLDTQNCFLTGYFYIFYVFTNLLNSSHADGFSACFFCFGYLVSLSSPVRYLKSNWRDTKGIRVYLFWEVRSQYLFCCLETSASF